MKYSTPLVLKKLIRREGETISILNRTETEDSDGRVTYAYTNTITTKGLVYDASGVRQSWYEIGFNEDIDYVLCLNAYEMETTISVGDLVTLSNGNKAEVREILPRGVGFNIDYQEILLKRSE